MTKTHNYVCDFPHCGTESPELAQGWTEFLYRTMVGSIASKSQHWCEKHPLPGLDPKKRYEVATINTRLWTRLLIGIGSFVVVLLLGFFGAMILPRW